MEPSCHDTRGREESNRNEPLEWEKEGEECRSEKKNVFLHHSSSLSSPVVSLSPFQSSKMKRDRNIFVSFRILLLLLLFLAFGSKFLPTLIGSCPLSHPLIRSRLVSVVHDRIFPFQDRRDLWFESRRLEYHHAMPLPGFRFPTRNGWFGGRMNGIVTFSRARKKNKALNSTS